MEQRFKYRMQNYDSKFSKNIWNEIERQLPKEKEDSNYFFILFLFFLLLFSIWGLYFLNQQNDPSQLDRPSKYAQVSKVKSGIKQKNSFDIQNHLYDKKNQIRARNYAQKSRKLVSKPLSILRTNAQILDGKTNLQSFIGEDLNSIQRQKYSKIKKIKPIVEREAKSNTELRSIDFETKGSCPKFTTSTKYPTLVAGLHFNMAMPYRMFQNDDYGGVTNVNNKSTSPRLSEGFGLSLGLAFNNKYTLGTGVNLQLLKETFSAQIVDSSQVRLTTITDYILDGNDVVDSLIRTVEEYNVVENQSFRNMEKLIGIPLFINYTINPRNKTRFILKTGVQVAFSKTMSAYRYKNLEKEVTGKMPNNYSSKYKYKGLGGFVGLQIQKSLGPMSNIYAEPNFRYLSYKTEGDKINIMVPGLKVGLTYHI